MALVRAYATDEYWAEYAVLVIRDRDGEADYESLGLLTESATDAQPGGTIALAGAGWLWARGSSPDGDDEVRLEAHDSAPPDDPDARAGWDDVLETPYLSFSGIVGLCWLTAGDDGEHTLAIGPPGRYRVRVCCRRKPGTLDAEAVEADTWLLQFWHAPDDDEPPRWLARAPAVPSEPSMIGDGTLDPHVSSVLWGAHIAVREHQEGASAAQIAVARATESAFADQTDPVAPLWPAAPRPPLTTGHQDLDAFEAEVHAQAVADWADRQHEVDEMAARLGVPAPATVGDVLPLLVRLGLLTVHEADGGEPLYRPADPAADAADAADAAGQQAGLGEQNVYSSAQQAADLVAVALWAQAGPAGTVADLADRLLMSPDEVRAALRYAEQEQLLRVAGDPRDGAAQLTLTALPRRDDPAGEQPAEPLIPLDLLSGTAALDISADISAALQDIGDKLPHSSALLVAAYATGPVRPLALPEGAPPRAGIVTRSESLVVWRGGRAEVVASVPGDAFRAVRTAYGVVVLSFGQSVLVRHGGQVEMLAKDADYRTSVSADGRYLAITQTRFGRWPKFELHVIDLADCSRQTLRWPDSMSIDGMYDGAVYFGSADAGSLRWTPGSDPEPLHWAPRAVDPLSGRMLVDGFDVDVDGWLVVSQDGERRNVLATGAAELAPGGAQMVYFRYDPPAVTLFDVATGGASPRVVWLPAGSDTGTHGWAWEDPGHLVFSRPYAQGARAVRLDIRTGATAGIPFPGFDDDGEVAVFVESLDDPGYD